MSPAGTLTRDSAVDAARTAWILAPANSPALDAVWDDLYVAVLGPPPDGSVPLPEVAA